MKKVRIGSKTAIVIVPISAAANGMKTRLFAYQHKLNNQEVEYTDG